MPHSALDSACLSPMAIVSVGPAIYDSQSPTTRVLSEGTADFALAQRGPAPAQTVVTLCRLTFFFLLIPWTQQHGTLPPPPIIHHANKLTLIPAPYNTPSAGDIPICDLSVVASITFLVFDSRAVCNLKDRLLQFRSNHKPKTALVKLWQRFLTKASSPRTRQHTAPQQCWQRLSCCVTVSGFFSKPPPPALTAGGSKSPYFTRRLRHLSAQTQRALPPRRPSPTLPHSPPPSWIR